MFYETARGDHGLPYNPFKAIVVPRPIAWVSTVSASGVRNLAPYSFFNAVGYYPPLVMIASGGRPPQGEMKHTMRNVIDTGEFVVNLVPYALREAMNLTAEELPEEADEYDFAGIEAADCHLVKAPRVKASPVAMECRLHATVPLPGRGAEADSMMAIGEVIGIHIDDAVITPDGRVDITRIRPLARMGYMDYTSVEHVFAMYKPLSDDHTGKITRDYHAAAATGD